MNSPNSNCFPLAMAGCVPTATTTTQMHPFLLRRREPPCSASAVDCSVGENFSIPGSYARLRVSLPRRPRPSSRGSHGINYPRPKPHVVTRGHSRESTRRYTRVSRPYARRVSAPSNLRVAAAGIGRIVRTGCTRTRCNEEGETCHRRVAIALCVCANVSGNN